jgi:hypothetical protein
MLSYSIHKSLPRKFPFNSLQSPVATRTLSITFYTTRTVVTKNWNRAGPVSHKPSVIEDLDVKSEIAKPDAVAANWVPKVKTNVNRAGPVLYKPPVIEDLDVKNESAKPDIVAAKWVPKVKSNVNVARPVIQEPSIRETSIAKDMTTKSKADALKSVPKAKTSVRDQSLKPSNGEASDAVDKTEVSDVVVRKWEPKSVEGAVVEPIPKAEVTAMH